MPELFPELFFELLELLELLELSLSLDAAGCCGADRDGPGAALAGGFARLGAVGCVARDGAPRDGWYGCDG